MARINIMFLSLLALVIGQVHSLDEYMLMDDHKIMNDYTSPLPYEYTDASSLPETYDLRNINNTNYLTRSLNQHIPQYCGSCWAHGAMSALADRIKIHRKAIGPDINLSIQYILNCGNHMAGSCHGGSHSGAYEFVKKMGSIPFETCMPYIACSKESSDGICSEVDTTCSKINTCRTCSTFTANKGQCVAVDTYPIATVAEYGKYGRFTLNKVHKIKAEIFVRGPVAAGVNAEPLVDYKGGIVTDKKLLHRLVNHVVSIVGWGKENGTEFWIVRNSWGEYWGELGFFRIETGHDCLGIESEVVWATPGSWTVENKACYEDGSNCGPGVELYEDPSKNLALLD